MRIHHQKLFLVLLLIFAVSIIVSYLFLGQSSSGIPTFKTLYPSPTKQANGSHPADVLDLTNWKLTLPTGSSEHPTEIKQPELATFIDNSWFSVTRDKKAVRFRAPVSAVTTTGSNYPRSELREMINDGKDKASWSSTSGAHAMTIEEAITAVPKNKQHVVAGQIHDADDDIIVFRLELPNLYINVGGKNVYTLDPHYTLGKRFTVKFYVHDGKTDVFYNNSQNPVYTLTRNYQGAYFKAGAYTQSNCGREGVASFCNENNYGEVVIYHLVVSHQ